MSDETKIKGMEALPHAGGVAFRWQGYSEAFEGHPSANIVSEPGEYDGFPCHAALSIGPYSALIFSQ